MRLSDWLAEAGITQDAFAKIIGVTQGRVSQLVRGERGSPSLSLATRIENATEGQVKPVDLLPTVPVGAAE